MNKEKTKWIKLFIVIIIGYAIAQIPPPQGLTVSSMQYMGLFIAMVILMIAGGFPDFLILLTGCTIMAMLKIVTFSAAFSGFSGTTVWLVIPAFAITTAMTKAGIFQRIALHIISWFPQTYRSQVLAMMIAATIVTPTIPSNLAKGSIMAPFSASVAKELGFKKGSKGASGIFLAMMLPIAPTGHAFFSGSVLVPMIMAYLPDASFSWLSWLAATFLWFIIVLVLSYFCIVLFYKDEVAINKDNTLPTENMAKARLKELGPMTRAEKQCAVLLVITLVLWMTESVHGISAVNVTLIALFVYFALGLITPVDFRTKIPWDMIVFLGGILSIPAGFTATGIDAWLTALLTPYISFIFQNPYLFIVGICVVIFVARIFIMSQVVIMTLGFVLFASVGVAYGFNPWVAMFATVCMQQVWTLSFTNSVVISMLGATGGDMVEFKDIQPMSTAFAVICLIALLASVPLWQAIGFIA